METKPERGGGVEIVFPPDVRGRINPTTATPYWWYGQITSTFPSGAVYTGTGTLIDGFYVLTCAHNIWSKDDGGGVKSVTFALAQNGNVLPYGGPTACPNAYLPHEYTVLDPPQPDAAGDVRDYTQYVYDFAVLKLANQLDPAGGVYPAMFDAEDDALPGRWSCIAGYPGDKQANTMWDGCYRLANQSDDFLFYRIDTYAGQSGSAVRARFRRFMDDTSRIIGVHVAGSAYLGANFAVRLTQDRINTIIGWMAGSLADHRLLELEVPAP